MLAALAKSVKEEVKSEHQLNATIEGNASSGWVLLDIGDIIVHLFSPEQRNYYRLEELWSGGKVLVKLQ